MVIAYEADDLLMRPVRQCLLYRRVQCIDHSASVLDGHGYQLAPVVRLQVFGTGLIVLVQDEHKAR